MPLSLEWMIAFGILLASLLVAPLARGLLRKLSEQEGFSVFKPILPKVASVLYILGLHGFSDVAPLPAKAKIWLDHGIYVLFVLLLLRLVRILLIHLLSFGIDFAARRSGANSETLKQGFVPLLRNLITILIFVWGVILVLQHFQYDVWSIIAALGVGSLAVGLAAQPTLANMISGFTLILDRNLSPGDRINLGGMIGDVEEIGLRSTRVRMGDGNTLIVPNSDLVNSKIINLSHPTREIQCTSVFKLHYETPFERVKTLCLEVLSKIEGLSPYRQSGVALSSLDQGYQTVSVSFFCHDLERQGAITSAFNENALERFRREGIELHVPNVVRVKE